MRYTIKDLLKARKKATLFAKTTENSESVEALGKYLRRRFSVPKDFVNLVEIFRRFLPGLTRGDMRRIYVDHTFESLIFELKRRGVVKLYRDKDGKLIIEVEPGKVKDFEKLAAELGAPIEELQLKVGRRA